LNFLSFTQPIHYQFQLNVNIQATERLQLLQAGYPRQGWSGVLSAGACLFGPGCRRESPATRKQKMHPDCDRGIFCFRGGRPKKTATKTINRYVKKKLND
jgi:hypothetical protein